MKRRNGTGSDKRISICRVTTASLLGALLLVGCGDSGEAQRIGQSAPAQTAEATGANGTAGNTEETADSPESPVMKPEETAQEPEGGYVFRLGEVQIAIDAPMAPVLAALGEPDSYFEAASCAFEGLDKIYTYPLVEIQTYPETDEAEVDLIASIFLRGEDAVTSEGLHIGSPREDVTMLYGGDYRENGSEYVYEKDGMELHILIMDDTVTSITYVSTILNG